MHPEIGSTWKAGDGRIVRVEEVIGAKARCTVLNAAGRMRGAAKRDIASTFGSFLVPHIVE